MAVNPYTAPTLATLVTQLRGGVQTALQGEQVGMARRAASYLLLRVMQDVVVPPVAWGLWGLYKAAELISAQSTPATATADALDRQGQRVNRLRRTATAAVRRFDLYGQAGAAVLAGAECVRGDGTVYALDSGYTWTVTGFSSGVTATCQTKGAIGNHDAGTYIRLVNPPAGVSAGVVDVGSYTVGIDAETDAVYRPDVIAAYQGAGARGGTIADWELWCHAVAGVDSVAVVSSSAGYVTLTVAGPGPTAPAVGVVEAVEAYLETVAPADVRFTVVAWSA